MNKPGMEARKHSGFFVAAIVLVFLVVIFVALLFGVRLLEKSESPSIEYSARYHELIEKELITEEERTELEVERCRYSRDLLNHLKETDLPGYDQAKSQYEATCQSKLPL